MVKHVKTSIAQANFTKRPILCSKSHRKAGGCSRAGRTTRPSRQHNPGVSSLHRCAWQCLHVTSRGPMSDTATSSRDSVAVRRHAPCRTRLWRRRVERLASFPMYLRCMSIGAGCTGAASSSSIKPSGSGGHIQGRAYSYFKSKFAHHRGEFQDGRQPPSLRAVRTESIPETPH